MKILKYLLTIITISLLSINYVYAEACDKEDLNRLKKIARKVEISYEQDVSYDEEYQQYIYDSYIIYVKGLTKEIYAMDIIDYKHFLYKDAEDDVVKKYYLGSGIKKIEIYSVDCNNQLLYTKKIKLPSFNYFSLDPLCEGISGDELAVCDEWYSGRLTQESFENKITQYKKTLKSTQKSKKETNELNKIYKFLMTNYYYLLGGILSLAMIVLIIIIIKRKRSELK